jgi:hypothetical protein
MTFVINASYDASVTSLATSNPTLYANYVGATQAAINYLEGVITNSITLTMSFGYGEAGGQTLPSNALGENASYYAQVSYAQIRSALIAADTTSAVQLAAAASLPATDPTAGAGEWLISQGAAVALGLTPAPGTSVGFIGLSSSQPFSWDQSNIAAGTYDAVGVLEHEITEVLGRVAFGGRIDTNTGKPIYSPLDLFRYTAADGGNGDPIGAAAGVRDEPFVAGYSASAYSYFSYNGTTIGLQFDTPTQVAAGSDVGDWAPSVIGDSFGFGSPGVTQLVSSTDLQVMNVLGYDLNCYLTGTGIATPDGEVAVQDLKVGDRVVTLGGGARPIIWIGFGRALAPGGCRNAATPIIVRKGALSDNVPNRDLHITKGHSLLLDGILIPAEFLVNHRSIVWDDRAQEVTVYHVELEDHDILLANGAPAESYRDDDNRWVFQNASAVHRPAPKPPFAPVLTGGPRVDHIWKRLLARGPYEHIPRTADPDLHLRVDGRRIDGKILANGGLGFRLPLMFEDVRIRSRAGAQDVLGLARDPRPLGVALGKIVIWRGRRPIVIVMDDPRLSDGFHDYESGNGFRWTSGDGLLPRSLFLNTGASCEIELHVASTTQYPLAKSKRMAA